MRIYALMLTAGPISIRPEQFLTMCIYSVILRDITFDNNMLLRVFKCIRPELLLHNRISRKNTIYSVIH